MFSRGMDEAYQDSGCTTLFVPNLVHIYLQGVAVVGSVHLRVLKSCLPCCIHDKKWDFSTRGMDAWIWSHVLSGEKMENWIDILGT